MDKLTNSLHQTLKNILHNHGNIELIIAYSGGVDSQVLLHALTQLKQKKLINNDITVCHVNHGLSQNAEQWQYFAEDTCDKLKMNLIVKHVNIIATPQKSLEALARDARYEALTSLKDAKSLILTGHHSDDQSETFLLALKRGAGLKGLSAMSAQTSLAQHILVRPLLSITRQEIESYAKKYALTWVEDESNLDTCFDRNFIRQKIIPLLRERWPSINTTINRSASHCLEGQELLNELAEQDLFSCKLDDNSFDEKSLDITALKLLSPARFNNLIRYFMALHGCLMPSTEQLNQVKFQLQASDDKNPQIKVADHFFRRFKNALFLTPMYIDISDWQAIINLTSDTLLNDKYTVNLPDNLGRLVFSQTPETHITELTEKSSLSLITWPKEGQVVTIRYHHDNPKCLPHYRQKSRTVKKVLQELSIAPWQRKRIAFLYYDDDLVAAVGHFICQPFISSDNQQGIHIEHFH